MEAYDRRSFLLGASCVLTLALPGCASEGGPQTSSESDPPTDSSAGSGSTAPERETTQAATETAVFAGGTVSALPEACPTDEFVGYTGTTPVPTPERSAELTVESARTYVVAYERYYLRYRALSEYGLQSPDSADLPAHDFPDVSMSDVSREVLDDDQGSYVVHVEYVRSLAGDTKGWFTVNYVVSNETLVRAEIEGKHRPGPNPYREGEIVSCDDTS